MPIGSDKGFIVKPGFDPLATQTSVSASGLYSWGYNHRGQLGLGDTVDRSSPVQVGITEWLTASGGYSWAGAIKTNNTLWTWGNNSAGQLGNGTTGSVFSTPIQVGVYTNWSQIAAGGNDGLAIKTDGTLWAWGQNAFGATGQGTTGVVNTPAQVGALTTWATIAGGFYASHAIKTDGTLWSWGYGQNGRLGLGNTTNYSSPVQVGALTTWLDITAGYGWAAAIKTDGTIWMFGKNDRGQLGQGTVSVGISSPVQVGALTTWLKIASGAYHVLAINTAGQLYAWGGNNYGGLGQGNTTNYSSPVQVGALTTWDKIAGGPYTSYAIKTDGAFWSWGYNHKGQLGVGNTTNYSSPVQIGALTAWSFLPKMSQSHGVLALQF